MGIAGGAAITPGSLPAQALTSADLGPSREAHVSGVLLSPGPQAGWSPLLLIPTAWQRLTGPGER